jgi:hypothetical protein
MKKLRVPFTLASATAFAPVVIAVAVTIAPGCSGDFARIGPQAHLVVHIDPTANLGKPESRLPLLVSRSTSFSIRIEAHKPDGSVDTSFNGFVRASIKPGTVVALHGQHVDGRNVQLVAGVADGLVVETQSAYGDARIWIEDVGYTPADPAGTKPPQCSDNVDNNGNGAIDFPADPGCAFANDDSEDTGSFATGASETVYFRSPRVADVRGFDPAVAGSGNGTVFPHEQVQIDTGWRGAGNFAFDTIVTRVAADGFYVDDTQNDYIDPANPAPGFGGVFAFTFSTPPQMRVCDRVKMLGGTATDFFGFTEIGFPTWLIEQWDPSLRHCGVPAPKVLTPSNVQNLYPYESALVSVVSAGTVSAHVTKHFGPAFMPLVNGVYTPGDNATNCDFNHNGKVDFSNADESACSTACDGNSTSPADPECSEFSAFAAHADFKLTVTDSTNNQTYKQQANGSSAATFDPLALRGQPIRSFSGTLRFFSGGSQFTIEARCADDIIIDPNTPDADLFCSDADYEAHRLCKTLDGQATTDAVPPAKRRLACVHARSTSDNNESSH